MAPFDAERSYTICKNGVGKVAKTGQHGGKQESCRTTSRPREQEPRHAPFRQKKATG